MSQYAAELCTLLVEDNFGDLFGRIYSTLVQYGRLTLFRLKEHSRVTDKQLRHALAALVQMHLVHHYTSIEDEFTYYEANVDGAYYLIRTGKVLEMVEERLGSYAAQVMTAIAYHGHIMVSELEALSELQVKDDAHYGNGDNDIKNEDNFSEDTLNGVENNGVTNGDGDDHTPSNTRLHSALNYLAGHGYICQVKDVHLHSLADNTLDAEREATVWAAYSDTKGKKKAAEIEEKMREILNKRLDADLSRGLTAYAHPPAIKRRQANGHSENPNKRRRLESDDEMENENTWDEDNVEDKEIMRPTLVVRVNYQKLDVVFRNRRLVELALQGTSPATAEVYETLLRLIEYKTPCCREGAEIPREGEEGETNSVAITLQRLATEVDPRLDLKGTLGPSEDPKASKNNKRSLANGVNGNHYEDDDDAETTRAHEIDEHLNILALPPYSLSTRRSQNGIPAWYVEYRRLARQLRHLEIERIVGIRFGKLALRVIQILLSMGKLDEKRLQEVSLISQKDLRQVLAQMQENGFVDLQEVPKDAQRLPNRTVFLWFYDPDRVGRNLLHDIYKAMSRCIQRLRFERNRLKDFLDKTERSDVRENEEKYLTEAELETLRQWREKEGLVLGEIARLDDLVAVFRDF